MNRKRMKKIVVFGMVLGLIFSFATDNVAYAKGGTFELKYETNAYNLLENFEEDSELCRKLQIDYNKSTTGLSEKKEKALNAVGVFDSDIEDLGQKTIDDINRAYSCSVYVTYYEEDEEEKGKLNEMTEEETDELIGKVYKSDLENTSKLKNFIQKNIFGTIKVMAKTKSDTRISNSGKMKQILWCTQTKKDSPIKVCASYIWLSRPKYTSTDVAGISIDNATLDGNTVLAYHRYDYKLYNSTSTKKSVDKKIEDVFRCSSGAAVWVTLQDDTYVDVINERVMIEFCCTKANKSSPTIAATGCYWHCQKKKNYSPGVSIGADGISLSVSENIAECYQLIQKNPYVKFYTK